MKKNSFLKGVITLIIGSIGARIIGFFIRIYFTRIIGEEGVSLYNIIMPTYVLVINLTTLGLPLAISIITSKGKYRGKNIILSTYPFILIINLIIMIFLVLSSSFIAETLLKTKNAKNLIISLSLTIPFISISSLLRGYFLGKQKMTPIASANILEQVIRLSLIIFILPLFIHQSIVMQVSIYILFSIISETSTILFFLLNSPKKIELKQEDFIPNLEITQKVAEYLVPTIGSRIVSNFIFFLEPIIIMHILLSKGLSSSYIRSLYGIYNMYSLSILMMPSFIINTLSTSLTPEISKNYNNKKHIKRRLNQSLQFTLFISIIFYTVIFLYPEFFLKLLYDTSKGASYIRVLTPLFILYNLSNPLMGCLNGMGKTNTVFKVSFVCILVKTIIMVILLFIMPGINGLVVSEIVYIILNFILLLFSFRLN